jgi:hypothetical protein
MRALEQLQDMGFTFEARGSTVRASYPHRVPPPAAADLLKELAAHKHEALRFLSEIEWRAAVMRKQVPHRPRAIPLLVARPEVRYRVGHCYSCGVRLADADRQSCDACVRAAWTVLHDREGIDESPQ